MIDLSSAQHYANVVRLHETVQRAAAEHYRNRGRTFVDVPQIVDITGACENVETLYSVGSRTGMDLYFSQTGQLHLEAALASFPAVWTRIHSGRDEATEDERHLREFTLTEEEFAWQASRWYPVERGYDEEALFGRLLDAIESVAQHIIGRVVTERDTLLREYGRNPIDLQYASLRSFGRVDYTDAVIYLAAAFPDLQFGHDLTAAHEAALLEHLYDEGKQLPTLLCRYPKDIKFFNMAVSRTDPRVCLSADLILPFAGEAAGAAVREHDYDRLVERLTSSRMFALHQERGGTLDDFDWYLQLVKSGATQPHAGYGLGNDRLVQYILGLSDIRLASPLAMLNRRTRMEVKT